MLTFSSKGKIELVRQNKTYGAAFCLTNNQGGNQLDMAYLHKNERAVYQGFKFEKRQKSYWQGRYAAKQAVEQLYSHLVATDYEITTGVFFFPILKAEGISNLQLSISHSGGVAAALAFPEAHPMGIDLEAINANKLEAMQSQMTEAERASINQLHLSDIIGHTIFWTMKEALSKIFKTGLMADFKIFEIHKIERKEGVYIGRFKHFGQYKALALVNDKAVLTIALPKNTEMDTTPIYEGLCDLFSEE